jgi:hypothetical protein
MRRAQALHSGTCHGADLRAPSIASFRHTSGRETGNREKCTDMALYQRTHVFCEFDNQQAVYSNLYIEAYFQARWLLRMWTAV